MSIDVLMPALSPTMEEGALAKWHVKAGDTVRSGDIIAEIETDKATIDVEAVDDGVVEVILVPAGTQGVKVNTPIARLTSAEEAPPPIPAAPASPASVATPPPVAAPAAATAEPATGDRVLASPLARRLAKEKGLDLAVLKGSGPHGRIVRADVDAPKAGETSAPAAAKPEPPKSTPPATVTASTPSLEQMGIPAGSYDLVPLDGMRRAIVRRMTDSVRNVPHFPLSIDLEIDRLLEARSRINGVRAKDAVRISVNDMIVKAAALALKKVPACNASYTPEGIALHHHADVAIAVAIEGGLITPIVRKAELKTLSQIAAQTRDLAERAKTRKLKVEEYQGGTFSISNLGMMGIRNFGSIINEPQGAILSVGAGEKRPVVRGDQIVIANCMSVTLTCDHRVVDGATGTRWLSAFRTLIEDPITMLA